MCGIGGIVYHNSAIDPELENQLNSLSTSFKYRGPDYTGIESYNNIGFIHNRLSIIDLSSEANQPFHSRNKDYSIVFNGEIYNYKELKKELESSFDFETTSDTEVILKGYQKWGIELLVQKLKGMYAFAIRDKNANKLILSRDYFGKKPFYYFFDNQKFIFASEIQGITNLIRHELSINYKALDYYLTELSVPQPLSIWNEIKQLPPNSFATLDLENLTLKIENSQQVIHYENKSGTTEKEALEKVNELITNAVIKRTIADVPIGTFLSGGVDSGLITSILAKNSNEKVNTFTLGFDFDDFNEFELAKKVADKYQTNHHEIKVNANINKDIEHIVQTMGEPFADSSILPTYYVTREIGKDLKVALSGDGGDEIFGGYHEYPTAYQTDQLIKQNKLNSISVSKSKLLNKLKISNTNLGHFKTYSEQKASKYLFREMGFNSSEKLMLYKNDKLKENINFSEEFLENTWNKNFKLSYLSSLFDSSIPNRLVNDYLVKVDRASMLNSIEVRSPFLDVDLLKYVSTLSNDILLKQGHSKYILKKLAQNYFDEMIFERKKQGFGIPIKYWIVNELMPLINHYLSKENVEKRGLFNYSFIESLIEVHKKNYTQTHKLWALLILEMWMVQNES